MALSVLPEDTVVGEDADFFYFPSYAGKDLGNPVLGAGTLWAITNENDGSISIPVFLSGTANTNILVDFWTSDNDALAGSAGGQCIHLE